MYNRGNDNKSDPAAVIKIVQSLCGEDFVLFCFVCNGKGAVVYKLFHIISIKWTLMHLNFLLP
jgi:hypothetical protein